MQRVEKQKTISSVVYWPFVHAGHLLRFVASKNVMIDAFQLGCAKIAKKVSSTVGEEMDIKIEENDKENGGMEVDANTTE